MYFLIADIEVLKALNYCFSSLINSLRNALCIFETLKIHTRTKTLIFIILIAHYLSS